MAMITDSSSFDDIPIMSNLVDKKLIEHRISRLPLLYSLEPRYRMGYNNVLAT